MADLVSTGKVQGRLQVDSTSQISLQRYNGKYMPLNISGAWHAKEIGSSGPTLSNSGLTQATLYYVYAYDSSGTLTLEASATAWAFDSTTGFPIKSGDDTRLLLGMVYMDTGSPGLFRDTTQKRWCANYYNRRDRDMTGTFSADRTSASAGSWIELNTEIRLECVVWADDACEFGSVGSGVNPNGGQSTHAGLAIDSTSTPIQSSAYVPSAPQRAPHCIYVSTVLSEGYHYVTLLASLSLGSATFVTADNITNGDTKSRLWGVLGAGQPDGVGGATGFDTGVFDSGVFDSGGSGGTGNDYFRRRQMVMA